jgi:hypothetical protein
MPAAASVEASVKAKVAASPDDKAPEVSEPGLGALLDLKV